jgi:hypothetical protein
MVESPRQHLASLAVVSALIMMKFKSRLLINEPVNAASLLVVRLLRKQKITR